MDSDIQKFPVSSSNVFSISLFFCAFEIGLTIVELTSDHLAIQQQY